MREQFTHKALVLCALLIKEGRFSSDFTSSLLEMGVDTWQRFNLADDMELLLAWRGGLDMIQGHLMNKVDEAELNATREALESGTFCLGNGEHDSFWVVLLKMNVISQIASWLISPIYRNLCSRAL